MKRFKPKTYPLFGAVVAVSFLIYVVKSRINNNLHIEDAVKLQPTAQEDITRNTRHHDDISKRRNSTQKTTEVKNTKMNHVVNSYINPLNKAQRTFNSNEILTKLIAENHLNSSVVMKKIDKENLKQHYDGRTNFPDRQQINTNFNLQSRILIGKSKNVSILSNTKIVIIIAYMRTGSTLTASLLQQYPGTFYVYEPLRHLYEAYAEGDKTHVTLNYISGIVRFEKVSDTPSCLVKVPGPWRKAEDKTKVPVNERYQVVIDEIKNWLTCRLDSISIESLTDDFHKDHTEYMRSFYYCAKGHVLGDSRSRTDIDACLKTAIGNCLKAPLLLLKFIRLKMEEIYPLLPLFSNMKIIHLVRDPRGILNSRFKVYATPRKKYQDFMQRHCSLVSDNIKFTKRILQEYQDRIKILHFEDLAEHPLETGRSLAEFTGIQFMKPMQDFIRNQTSSSRNSCAYCTQRKNSSTTAHEWRKELKPKYAAFIDNTCQSSNSILGYLPLAKSALKNMNIPSRKNVNIQKELLC